MKTKWDEKKTSIGNAIIISTTTLLIGILIGTNWQTWFANFMPYLTSGKTFSTVDWSPLNEVYEKIATTYNGEFSTTELIEGAKKGLVSALGDKYTAYMDAKETQEFNKTLHGDVGSGVGIEMGLRDGYVRVLRTLPDNPARSAGILAGDIIYKVDHEEVYSLSVEKIAAKIRGEAGSEVTLTVVRNGEEIEKTMVREAINNVSAYINYDGTTAIITLTRFDEDTGTMVQKFAQEFSSHNINKVILDLRGNAGGYVSSAQDLLSLWLDGEKMLIQKSQHFQDSSTSTASGKAILADLKTVVLVNGTSASASEIVAGALQDYKKATIVGETTYGKGVVQNLYNLSGGTLLKVTTANWFTPLNRSINDAGITPDIEVVRTFDDINTMHDPQLDKAKKL